MILRKQKKYGEAVRQYLDVGHELDALSIAVEHIDVVVQDPDVEVFHYPIDFCACTNPRYVY